MSENVRRMFAEISGKYDFMNSLLSLGIHHKWRAKTVKLSGAAPGMSVLDCASGTGDLAIKFKQAVGDAGQVTGTDFCEDMLQYAQPKAEKKNLNIKFEFADVMNLQYDDDSFDISSIAYGIRNVDSPADGLSEMARVVKSGGKVVVLEFGQPKGIFSLFYKFYGKVIMPLAGKIFAKSGAAYNYLPETASRFPCREDFLKLMEGTGMLEKCYYKSLTFGIAFIYIGTVK
jgi:demethylmenaquinone methyltransferase/2-methoxy-6-polyprenyl-1,4-benzoquinol methylase